MRPPKLPVALYRTIPLAPVQLVANAALSRVLKRHPRLFDRLGVNSRKTFAFVPTDLPFAFVIRPDDGRLSVVRPERILRADVRIGGPIVTLLTLAEGRADGDAEFFARDLSVDGDMEAALALRNAMDDCRIDLPSDLAPSNGPLRQPVKIGLAALRTALTPRGGN